MNELQLKTAKPCFFFFLLLSELETIKQQHMQEVSVLLCFQVSLISVELSFYISC